MGVQGFRHQPFAFRFSPLALSGSQAPRRGMGPLLGIALGGLASCWARQVLPPMTLRRNRNSDAAGVEFFETKVRPVLFERCFSCHGAKLQQGGLRLDSQAVS